MAQSIIRIKKIDALIVHHTVTPQLASKEATMNNLNSSPNAYDGKSPYTYVGGHNWNAIGRPDNTVGQQSGSSTVTNQQSMGIVLVGNFQIDTPTEYQKKWLGDTLKMLMQKYGVSRNRVFLHREVRDNPTACPGSKITQAFISSLLTPTPMPTCEQNLAAAKEEIRKLNTEIGRVTGERDTARTERDTARTALAEEKRQHAETVKRADDNYKKWQDALDAQGPLKQKIENAKNALA